VFVLATTRTSEADSASIQTLHDGGVIRRLALEGLNERATGELLEVTLGGPADRGLVQQLFHRCAGNALFLMMLVRGAEQAGTLAQDGGVWFAGERLVLAEDLLDLIETEIGGLDEVERDLLEVVAYAESADCQQLVRAGDHTLLQGLERRGLLV